MLGIVRTVVSLGLLAATGTATGDTPPRSSHDSALHGMKALRSYRPNVEGRPTVCLVHGMNSSSGGFVHMISFLEEAGYGVVVYDYPFRRGLDESAAAFVRDWREFRKRVGERRHWALLTHSMGAMLARYYVEGPDYGGDVNTLILIGPPNAGSAIARAQPLLELVESAQSARPGGRVEIPADLGEAADDLLPGSRFLQQLAARPRREGVAYHILAGNVGFVDQETRRRIESRFRLLTRNAGVLGGLARLAGREVLAGLDELTDGTGDGAVSVASTRLEGVDDHVVIPANHVELIRAPLLYPDPGPVACMPHVLRWLREAGHQPAGAGGDF